MTDKLNFTVHKIRMLDTGIGREAGYRDDAHMLEVAKAERAAMTPEARALAEAIDERIERAFLFGEE